MAASIGIVDYQMGNLASLQNSLAVIGSAARIVRDPCELRSLDKLILPGVGAFGDAADHLHKSGLDEAITAFVRAGKPLFGICLGMQMLFERSEESIGAKGLGLLAGEVKRFDPTQAAHPIKIPHMGWNAVHTRHKSPLFEGLNDGDRLYFVHSFHAVCNESETILSAFYGYEFPAAVGHDNIFGLQPHPEKSHKTGLEILQNFTEL
ncbi:imidazole glycerol phosphate synthase subunit HisH [Campylobacterota bacterium]|nr:imidazole glycerol phosphate synthase subunit HisH [Campylobacterota bacterium]